MHQRIRTAVGIGAMLTLAGSASATFHFMQIEQVIGGVEGDTSAQAIQLRMRAAGQNLVAQSRLIVYDATGSNPVTVINITANVPNGLLGDRVLIVTNEMLDYLVPPIAPDFIMTNPIPESYMAAGRLTFESDLGEILWSLAWGGSGYTGSNMGSLDNDLDGNFGPPFPSPLPKDSTSSLRFKGAANARSTNNAADYEITASAAVLTNNARASGTVTPPPCYADYNGDGSVNTLDFIAYLNDFNDGVVGDDDCDGNGSINTLDFICFLNAFNEGC